MTFTPPPEIPTRTLADSKVSHLSDHMALRVIHNYLRDKVASLLTKAQADQLYATVGSVGGGLTQVLADLRYAALVHGHNYAATSHTHSDYPAPSDGTPTTVADTGSAGNGTAYARWNHVHGKGTHTHAEADVTSLVSDLAAKAAATHLHAGTYAPAAHTHVVADLPTGATATTVALGNHSHPAADLSGYQTRSEKAAASGYASLDAATKVPIGQIPTGTTSSTVSLGDHTHPSAGVAVQKVTADQASTSVTLADATNMGFAAAANGNYEFEYLLAITSAALTTGWQFGFTGPTSPTMFVAVCEHQSSATAWTTATLAALGNLPLVTAAYAAATPIVVRIKGVLANGANAGTLQLRFATEVAASAVTLKRGSTLIVA